VRNADNYGGDSKAVRLPSSRATLISASLMVVLTLAVHIDPGWFIRPFTGDPAVVVVGATFLQVISWNFVASGINFTCSAMFQALGNTWPALLSTGMRLLMSIWRCCPSRSTMFCNNCDAEYDVL
jgi:Na+-driven multidrug efflux pump